MSDEDDEPREFGAYDEEVDRRYKQPLVLFGIFCCCCIVLGLVLFGVTTLTLLRRPTECTATPALTIFDALGSPCCDITTPECVMGVNLQLLSADFGATGDADATYSLGACFAGARLLVDLVAVTSDASTARFTEVVKLDKQGAFTVAIPPQTTDLRAAVRLAQSTTTAAAERTMQFAAVRTDVDNYRQRSLLSIYDDEALLSQHLMIQYANRVAYDASGYDSTPISGKPPGEQAGPHRSSRAMAITQIAVLDAMIGAGVAAYKPYALTGIDALPRPASVEAAVARATYDTLVYLYPSQAARLAPLLDAMLASVDDGAAKANGIEIGKRAAAAIVAARKNDGSAHAEQQVGIGPNDYHLVSGPGEWSPDPISGFKVALGARWAQLVRPFVLDRADQFRAPTLDLSGPEYVASFNEVKAIGGDGKTTPTTRDIDQERLGIFFAYDGSFQLCAPPRLYNQMLAQFACDYIDSPARFAYLLAMGNIAMADAGIASWESKWHYRLWRPVTGIRAPPITSDTVSDPTWTPLGAPGSNGGVWFSPPFPAYPSGHATFGGAIAEVLRAVLGTDAVQFTFISDEFNGKTVGVGGETRALLPRAFMSLTELEMANAFSRMPLGIHWRIDATSGIEMGHQVARQTLAKAYRAK